MEHLARNLYNKLFKGTPKKKLRFDISRSSNVESYSLSEGIYTVDLYDLTFPLALRDRPSSDYDVLIQVFYKKEYKIAQQAFELNFPMTKPRFIVDAGANVGYTSLFFVAIWPNVEVVSIEPDINNFNMLKRNVALFPSITPFNRALAHKADLFFDIAPDDKGLGDWAKTTKVTKGGAVKGITIQQIIENADHDIIDILKMDIEGAERFVFGKEANLDFLAKTRILVMEIHDKWPIRENIYGILRSHQFCLVNHEELTMGINISLIENA